MGIHGKLFSIQYSLISEKEEFLNTEFLIKFK